jgi:hypothetical protein
MAGGDGVLPQDDIEAIKRLKARYFRCIDTKQWDELRALFMDDAQYQVDGGSGRHEWSDADSFLAHLRQRFVEGTTTVHHGHMPELELLDASSAIGVWAMYDYVDVPGTRSYQGFGHYHETYRKVDGSWKIASLRLTRLRVDLLPVRPERRY